MSFDAREITKKINVENLISSVNEKLLTVCAKLDDLARSYQHPKTDDTETDEIPHRIESVLDYVSSEIKSPISISNMVYSKCPTAKILRGFASLRSLRISSIDIESIIENLYNMSIYIEFDATDIDNIKVIRSPNTIKYSDIEYYNKHESFGNISAIIAADIAKPIKDTVLRVGVINILEGTIESLLEVLRDTYYKNYLANNNL